MKRHSMFEDVPAGFRFYSTGEYSEDRGVWVPVPVYWLLSGWRNLLLAYLRWTLRRKLKGKSLGKGVIVCLKCGAHNDDDPDFDPLHCWNCDNVLERER